MRLTFACCSVLAALVLPLQALAAAGHHHGVGLLQLVLAEKGFSAELTLPAADLVGFEHPPANDGERAALALAIALLEAPEAVLAANKEADCRGQLQAIESNLLNAAPRSAHADTAGHGDGHEAQAEHAHHDHAADTVQTHNDVLARYSYSCRKMQALTALELNLFSQLQGLQKVELQWLSSDRSGSGQLTPQTPRFSWP